MRISFSDYTAAVRVLLLALLPAAASTLYSEGTVPKLKPEEYDSRATSGDLTIAASYYSRSFSSGGQSFFLSRHLVVAVAIYGPPFKRAALSNGQFTLHVNGAKYGILPVAGGLVAYDSTWGGVDKGVIAQVGPVIIGPPTQSRFPGDRREVPTPRVPDSRPSGQPPKQEADLPALLNEAAMPQGESVVLPVGGYLYFPYEKKLKSVKKLELEFRDAMGSTALRLK